MLFKIENTTDATDINTGNHWDNGIPPDDYNHYIPFSAYVSLFHENYKVINISKYTIQ